MPTKLHKTQTIIGEQFIWLHVPKTAGTALSETLIKLGIGKRLEVQPGFTPKRVMGAHLTFDEVCWAMGPDRKQEISLAVVRHPKDWIQSLYNQWIKHDQIRNFDQFVALLEKLPSQRNFVHGVKCVYHYEHIRLNDIVQLLAQIEGKKVGNVEVPRVNESDRRFAPLTTYEMEKLEKYWVPDMEFFNYYD